MISVMPVTGTHLQHLYLRRNKLVMIEEYKSETGVDKWIRENIFTDYKYRGVMIEVGAATPDYISNSYHWRKNGWRTIAIEPNPYFVDLHKKEGSEVLPYACSNEDLDNVDFTIIGKLDDSIETSFHSFSHISDNCLTSQDIPKDWKISYNNSNKVEIKISVKKLDTIIKELKLKKIDILTIDVEGNEGKVLEGLNLKKHKPKVIVLENICKFFDFNQLLSPYGYEHVTTLGDYDEIYLLK